MAKTYVRSSLIERQERDYACTEKLYDLLPIVGDELKDVSSDRVGQMLGISSGQMKSLALTLSSIGILSRRIEYKHGRTSHWKLTLSKDEGLKLLKKHQDKERTTANRAPVDRVDSPKSVSLKSKIIEVLNTSQSFKTVDELAAQVMDEGRKIDFHNLTHVLYSLRKENKITFENGKTKDRVPFNIRLAKNGASPVKVREVTEPERDALFVEPVEDINPFLVTFTVEDQFPLIKRLKDRRLLLEQAAKLAEDADETDLALSLLEKAGMGATLLEQEAVRLFEAHLRCLSRTV